MPRSEYVEGLTIAMAKALVDLIPFAGAAKKIIEFHVEYAGATFSAQKHKEALNILVSDIVTLTERHPDSANPGSAASAAYDFIKIVETCKITPTLLIDLELNPTKIRNHLLGVADPTLKTASSLREKIVQQAIALFSERLIEISPLIPGIETAYRQTVLNRQKQS